MRLRRRAPSCLAAFSLLALGWASAAAARPPADPRWPSLATQLAEARVAADEPLGRLIAANQDFSLLRPEELGDDLPLPAWLRVLWRKAHPDAEYLASDPTGGYPLALRDAHEWMLAHPALRPGPPREPEPAREKAEIVLGDRRISGLALSPRSESDIRVNFRNPTQVLAASNNVGDSGRQAMYRSTDGGGSWTQSELPFVSHDVFHTDPAVEWTSDGIAWSTTIGVTDNAEDLRMRLYRSTDAGATWAWESTFSSGQTTADKEMIWVDHAPDSPYLDTLYAIWHADRPVYVNRRRANAWADPVRVSGSETTGTGIGADVVTNGAGKVFAFWPDTGSRRIYLVTSTDGGDSWSRPRAIASTFDSFDIGIPAQARRKVLIYVAAAAFSGDGKDLVYATWTDLSGASGCRNSGNAPGTNAGSSCKTRIWISRSTDGGATWSAKRLVRDVATKNDQFFPALAVDETSGALALVYYDTTGDNARRQTHVWLQTSTDDGGSWSEPLRVTSASSNETSAGADSGNQYGDYTGLSGWAGTFLPSWTDRRSGGHEEIWSAAFAEATGPCTPPAAPASLTATAGTNRVDLAWPAVPGATEHRVYRATASGGPYVLVARVAAPAATYGDTGLDGGTQYYYVVRAYAGCESPASNEASATPEGGAGCTPTQLAFDDFEHSTGYAGWSRGSLLSGGSVTDWRGVQVCGAASGSHIFRFGGRGCRSEYDGDRFAFAQPGGAAGIAVPAGATQVRLSFAHRWRFERGADGGTLAVALDGGGYGMVPPEAMVGAVYNGLLDDFCPPGDTAGTRIFTGHQESFVSTQVDLDAVCNAALGGSGGCAGHSLGLAFVGITDCFVDDDGWFLDDVTVSACVP